MKSLLACLALALLPASALAASVRGTLTGRVVDWPGGTAELRVETETGTLVAAGSIDGGGSFRVPLPARVPKGIGLPSVSGLFASPSNYGDTGCRGEGKATPGTVRYKFFQLIVRRGPERVGDITLDNSGQLPPTVGAVVAPLLYFDTSTTLQGTVECVDENFQETLSGTFAAG